MRTWRLVPLLPLLVNHIQRRLLNERQAVVVQRLAQRLQLGLAAVTGRQGRRKVVVTGRQGKGKSSAAGKQVGRQAGRVKQKSDEANAIIACGVP